MWIFCDWDHSPENRWYLSSWETCHMYWTVPWRVVAVAPTFCDDLFRRAHQDRCCGRWLGWQYCHQSLVAAKVCVAYAVNDPRLSLSQWPLLGRSEQIIRYKLNHSNADRHGYIPLNWSMLKSGPKNRCPITLLMGGVAVDADIALFGGSSSKSAPENMNKSNENQQLNTAIGHAAHADDKLTWFSWQRRLC